LARLDLVGDDTEFHTFELIVQVRHHFFDDLSNLGLED
jgi:hypothetical protein